MIWNQELVLLEKMNQEGQEIFDLKSLTKEEVFYRLCQGVVSSKMREAQRQKELQRQN